jgi:hypothetical protein
MIPDKFALLRAAECKEMTDDVYDRYWERIHMSTLVSMCGTRRWLTFGSCDIPFQLGGKHTTCYWILVTPVDEDGYECDSEWHLFDGPESVIDTANEYGPSFSMSVRTWMWGWD